MCTRYYELCTRTRRAPISADAELLVPFSVLQYQISFELEFRPSDAFLFLLLSTCVFW